MVLLPWIKSDDIIDRWGSIISEERIQHPANKLRCYIGAWNSPSSVKQRESYNHRCLSTYSPGYKCNKVHLNVVYKWLLNTWGYRAAVTRIKSRHLSNGRDTSAAVLGYCSKICKFESILIDETCIGVYTVYMGESSITTRHISIIK